MRFAVILELDASGKHMAVSNRLGDDAAHGRCDDDGKVLAVLVREVECLMPYASTRGGCQEERSELTVAAYERVCVFGSIVLGTKKYP